MNNRLSHIEHMQVAELTGSDAEMFRAERDRLRLTALIDQIERGVVHRFWMGFKTQLDKCALDETLRTMRTGPTRRYHT